MNTLYILSFKKNSKKIKKKLRLAQKVIKQILNKYYNIIVQDTKHSIYIDDKINRQYYHFGI